MGIFGTRMVVLLFLLVSSFFMSFSVCRIDRVDGEGNVTTVTHSLCPDSVTLEQGYDAMKEDPSFYKTLDFCGYSAPRQFPDMQLPVPGAPVSAQQSSTTSTPHQFIPEHLITVIQGMHDEHVHFLKPLGRDPCSYFKEKDEARILGALGPDVVVCPFCSRRFRSHQKLVSHCKRCHCKSLALKCTSCAKVFGDPYALKIHMRLHFSSERVQKCHICNKAYLTKSKLNEHSKFHVTGKPQCEHCDRLFADPKSLADHKKICSKCPGAADLMEEQRKPHKCPHYYKRYTRASDVVHHCKSKHPDV